MNKDTLDLETTAEEMEVSQTIETEEELLTCLHIKLYHPQQASRGLYRWLPIGTKHKHSADEPLRLGRDAQGCTFALADPRVSRKQLAIQAYRVPHNPCMLFSIQNLSQKGRLSVNGTVLGYLERKDLQDKALIRLGEYEVLVVREDGEAKESFEVDFEVLSAPPSRELGVGITSMTPIMEMGSYPYEANGFPAELRSHGPLESDETLMCHS